MERVLLKHILDFRRIFTPHTISRKYLLNVFRLGSAEILKIHTFSKFTETS